MPIKIPRRKADEISQQFNDGVVDVYSVSDEALPGYQPKPHLTKKEHLFFSEQRLGINRLYLSREHHAEILKVVRVPRRPISPQDVAIIGKNRYTIDAVQSVADVYPPCLDLSLTALKQEFEGLIE